jgi:hypothetical protein
MSKILRCDSKIVNKNFLDIQDFSLLSMAEDGNAADRAPFTACRQTNPYCRPGGKLYHCKLRTSQKTDDCLSLKGYYPCFSVLFCG